MKKYEYPLKSPNCLLTRKNGNNPIKMFGYWDGSGSLEVYVTPNDSECSLITLDLLKDEYTLWYSCSRRVPNVTDYKLTILRDIYCPKNLKKVVKAKEVYTGFSRQFSPPEDCDE